MRELYSIAKDKVREILPSNLPQKAKKLDGIIKFRNINSIGQTTKEGNRANLENEIFDQFLHNDDSS